MNSSHMSFAFLKQVAKHSNATWDLSEGQLNKWGPCIIYTHKSPWGWQGKSYHHIAGEKTDTQIDQKSLSKLVLLRIQVSSFAIQLSDIIPGKCWQIPTLSCFNFYFHVFHQCPLICNLGWLPSGSKYVKYDAQVSCFMVCSWFKVSVCFCFNYTHLDMLLQS